MQGSTVCGQAFDGRHLVALGLNREHQAGTHGGAVEQNRAAPANAVLATDVGTGQAEVMTQVVGEQPASIAWRCVDDAVDPHAANAFSVRTRTS